MRYHDGKITKLEPNEIFCYGANLAGIHGLENAGVDNWEGFSLAQDIKNGII